MGSGLGRQPEGFRGWSPKRLRTKAIDPGWPGGVVGAPRVYARAANCISLESRTPKAMRGIISDSWPVLTGPGRLLERSAFGRGGRRRPE